MKAYVKNRRGFRNNLFENQSCGIVIEVVNHSLEYFRGSERFKINNVVTLHLINKIYFRNPVHQAKNQIFAYLD